MLVLLQTGAEIYAGLYAMPPAGHKCLADKRMMRIGFQLLPIVVSLLVLHIITKIYGLAVDMNATYFA